MRSRDLSRGVIRLEVTKSGKRREIPMRQVVYDLLAGLPGAAHLAPAHLRSEMAKTEVPPPAAVSDPAERSRKPSHMSPRA